MSIVVWIALGVAAWTLCGLLAVGVACAASRGDRLSADARHGRGPSLELTPRRRMVIDVTPVTRPWVVAATAGRSTVVAAVSAEYAQLPREWMASTSSRVLASRRGLVGPVAQDPREAQRDAARVARARLDAVEGDLHDELRADVHDMPVSERPPAPAGARSAR